MATNANRFWAKVAIGDGCWEWEGARERGYGLFWADGRLVRAHRWAWEERNGLVPAGMLVLHRCDNRPCVNPEHLFLGTNADNNRDMQEKGRHPGRKLTPADVEAVYGLLAAGQRRAAIAARFGVHPSAISRIASRQRAA
jgi:hypothetical protein